MASGQPASAGQVAGATRPLKPPLCPRGPGWPCSAAHLTLRGEQVQSRASKETEQTQKQKQEAEKQQRKWDRETPRDPQLPRLPLPGAPSPCLLEVTHMGPPSPKTLPPGTFTLSGLLSPRPPPPRDPCSPWSSCTQCPLPTSPCPHPHLHRLDLWGSFPCKAPMPPTSLCSEIKGVLNPFPESLVAKSNGPSCHFDQSREMVLFQTGGAACSSFQALGTRHGPTTGPLCLQQERDLGSGSQH